MEKSERIEKKIFFKITRSIVFIIAFLAFVTVIAGIFTWGIAYFSNPKDADLTKITIEKNEIDFATKENKSNNLDSNMTASSEVNNYSSQEAETELDKQAKIFVIKLLKAQDVEINSDSETDVKNNLLESILAQYSYNEQVYILTQLNELSKSFEKAKFVDKSNAFFDILKTKYENEQKIIDKRRTENTTRMITATAMIGSGILTFAFFVMILVLLRVEKNTRPIESQNDTYDSYDKKLLAIITGISIVISIIVGFFAYNNVGNSDIVDATQQAKALFNERKLQAIVDQQNADQDAMVNQQQISETESYVTEANVTAEEVNAIEGNATAE